MTIITAATLQHWNYLLALEDDLERLSRYVDFSGNGETYSIEIARLLMAASAEVDVVVKQICHALNADTRASSITAYHPIIHERIPEFMQFVITIPRFALELRPWSTWTEARAPLWWTATNRVKHQRHTDFQSATLTNCLNSMAGLFVSVLFLYQEHAREGTLAPPTKLFDVPDQHSLGERVGGRYIIPMIAVPEFGGS